MRITKWDGTSKQANLDTLKFTGVFNNRTVSLLKREYGLYLPHGLMLIVK